MAVQKKIGDLLVEAGLIDEDQLKAALFHQQQWGGKLGGCLVQMGMVTEHAIAKALAKKLKYDYAELFDPALPAEVVGLVKAAVAKKYHCMPVRLEDKTLVVALSDPHNIDTLDMIRFATGLKVKPAFALESEIADAIARYYDGKLIVKDRDAVPFRQAAAAASDETLPAADFVLGDLIEIDEPDES